MWGNVTLLTIFDLFYIRLFFEACETYRRAPSTITPYQDVYDWMAYSILKGSRTPKQVRAFSERVYNAQKRQPGPGGSHAGDSQQSSQSSLEDDPSDPSIALEGFDFY